MKNTKTLLLSAALFSAVGAQAQVIGSTIAPDPGPFLTLDRRRPRAVRHFRGRLARRRNGVRRRPDLRRTCRRVPARRPSAISSPPVPPPARRRRHDLQRPGPGRQLPVGLARPLQPVDRDDDRRDADVRRRSEPRQRRSGLARLCPGHGQPGLLAVRAVRRAGRQLDPCRCASTTHRRPTPSSRRTTVSR